PGARIVSAVEVLADLIHEWHVDRLELLLIFEDELQHLLARRVGRRQRLRLAQRFDPLIVGAELPPLAVVRLRGRAGGEGGGDKKRCDDDEGNGTGHGRGLFYTTKGI